MGGGSKKQCVKCHCNKRVIKSESKPQRRGPGVAELERILSSQGIHPMDPFYGHQQASPPSFSAFQFHHSDYFGRLIGNGEFLNMMRSEQGHEAIPDPNYGLSYTQMMTMDYDHPLFQLCMKSVSQSMDERFYNISSLDKFQHEMNRFGSGTPCQFYTPLLGQSSMDNANTLVVYDPQNMLHRNAAESSRLPKMNSLDKHILTLGTSNLAEKSSLTMKPIIMESDSSSESQVSEEQYKGHQIQISGFSLQRRGLSMYKTKQNLSNIAVPSTEHTLDLTLKL